jgi:hypothetical protein
MMFNASEALYRVVGLADEIGFVLANSTWFIVALQFTKHLAAPGKTVPFHNGLMQPSAAASAPRPWDAKKHRSMPGQEDEAAPQIFRLDPVVCR